MNELETAAAENDVQNGEGIPPVAENTGMSGADAAASFSDSVPVSGSSAGSDLPENSEAAGADIAAADAPESRPLPPVLLTVGELKKLLAQVLETITGLPPGRVICEGDGESGPRPGLGPFAPHPAAPHPALYCSLAWQSLELLPQNNGDYSEAVYQAGESAPAVTGQNGGQTAATSETGAAPANSAATTNSAGGATAATAATAAADGAAADETSAALSPAATSANNAASVSGPGSTGEINPPEASSAAASPAAASADPAPGVPAGQAEAGLIQTLRHESWCEVRVSFWGPRAFEAAALAAQALQSDARWFDLWRIIGFGGAGPLIRADAPFRGAVQARCYFDLSFYACFGAAYPAEWFNASLWNLPRLSQPFLISKE